MGGLHEFFQSVPISVHGTVSWNLPGRLNPPGKTTGYPENARLQGSCVGVLIKR